MENTLSGNIKRIAKEKKMNSEAIALKSGLALSTVNKIMYGETTNPTLKNIRAVSKALDCSLDELITGEKPKATVAELSVKLGQNKLLYTLVAEICDIDETLIPSLLTIVHELPKNRKE